MKKVFIVILLLIIVAIILLNSPAREKLTKSQRSVNLKAV